MEATELESLLAKVGGKYKLVTLYQKRMRELQRGLPRLIAAETTNLWDIVAKEIAASKVDLIMGEEAEQMRKEIAIRESEEAAEQDAKGQKGEKGEKEKTRLSKAES